jgi:predicted MFS family arabinose efflux permease
LADPSLTPSSSRAVVVTALGTAQTLSWASTYYVPAILAEPMAASLGLSRSWVFAAFSAALLITAVLGPSVGRVIDRYGGRGVLAVSNLVIAAGLALLAAANGPITLFVAWAILGVGMALGLYDAAFAALTALYGSEARSAITGITLFAGFASTVSWPVSALLNEAYGWQMTCLVWAALNLVIALPLNRFLLPPIQPRPRAPEAEQTRIGWTPRREMILLAFFFAGGWFVAGAMAAHLPSLLERAGASPLEAIAAAALVGPAQVTARVAEFALLRRVHPLVSARIALVLHLLGIGALALFGAPAAVAFALLFGAGNGLLTIARGTLPLALFGPYGYGERSGLLGAPARLTQAFAPFIFGFLLESFGVSAIGVSAVLFIAGLIALLALRARPTDPPGGP